MDEKFLISDDGKRVFRYYAFISYKHADKNWGKWVQKGIEGYRLPGKLCSEYELPQRVTPIFRDETDLTTGDNVNNLLFEQLKQCKYLIVICSKHMQIEPKYINYEIEEFLKLGNPISHILPVIVDGVACSADPSQECLPPALLNMGDDRPLGVTVKAGKKKDAILKLVAAMLGLDLISLRSHEKERKMKNRIRMLVAGIVFASAFAVFMFYEYLQINEAKMNQENSYAYITMQNGDKLKAAGISEQVIHNASLLNQSIRKEAQRIHTLSSIHAKYTPLTMIGNVDEKWKKQFTNDGKFILLNDENVAYKYDDCGNLIWCFEAYKYGGEIKEVSSDGIHAVISIAYEVVAEEEANVEYTGTYLWLCNMETGERMTELISSEYYDRGERERGELHDVAEAHFSPDGKVLCAFRSGGYFNTNDELPIWDSNTGEKIESIPGELLGTREEGGSQGEIVEEFGFISDTLMYWKGSLYYVFYDLAQKEISRVPFRDWSEIIENSDWNGYRRYFVKENAGEYYVFDAAKFIYYEGMIENESIMPNGITGIAGNKMMLAVPFIDKSGKITRIQMVNLDTMELMAEYIPKKSMLNSYTSVNIYAVPGTNRIYMSLEGKGGKQFLRYDPIAGSFQVMQIEENVDTSSNTCFIGSYGATDILAIEKKDGVILKELSETEVDTYVLDEPYSAFVDNVVISAGENRMLMTMHNNAIYLYPISYAGEMYQKGIEYDSQGKSIYAVSQTGDVIVKAQGNNIEIWRSGKLCDYEPIPNKNNILSMDMDAQGNYLVIGAGKEIFLYEWKDECYVQKQTRTWENGNISLVKFADKRIVVLLSDQESQEYRIGGTIKRNKLLLLDDTTLDMVYEQENDVYGKTYGGLNESENQFVSVSPDGKFYVDIEMYPIQDKFTRTITVHSVETGEAISDFLETVLTEAKQKEIKDESELDIVNYSGTTMINFSHVTFADNNQILAGWSNGCWIFESKTMKPISYFNDSSWLSDLPLMMKNGLLLYPAGGFHIWDSKNNMIVRRVDGVCTDENPGKMLLSEDERWLIFTDAEKTKIYRTDDWSLCGVVSTSVVDVLFADENCLIYDTGKEIYKVEI